MKPTGKQVSQAAVSIIRAGYTYDEMDCQAFVEEAVKQAGGSMAYRGSNDMARGVAWLGTLENARADGKLIPGCLLFIHEDTENNLPDRYRGDGMGDFSHVGLYLGDGFPYEAAQSSASRGGTAASTLRNGWTHVGLAKEIDYGMEINPGVYLGAEVSQQGAFGIVDDESIGDETAGLTPGNIAETAASRYATVISPNGYGVKLRKSASAQEPIYWMVAPGARVLVERVLEGWALVRAISTDKSGQHPHERRAYMMTKFLQMEE